MNKSVRCIKGLGEVSIRVKNIDAMQKFYEEVVGLEVLRRDESLGLKVHATEHEWIHVRSLYFSDPEGNLLEFVCYDASVK